MWRSGETRTGSQGACLSNPVLAEPAGRLRRAYLGKDEGKTLVCRPPRRLARPSDGTQARQRGFTFDGHRLASLYRTFETALSRLTSGYAPLSSSLQKYAFAPSATCATSGEIVT